MNTIVRIVLVLSSLIALVVAEEQCQVFCGGEIMDTIQMSGLFSDDKHFVDMPMKVDPEIVVQEWQEINRSDHEEIRKFVEDFFAEPGSDIQDTTPLDWSPRPVFLDNLANHSLAVWASKLNYLWKQLARKPSASVYNHPSRHSLLGPLHPIMIVPGGRFREEYYWDTLLVQKGLLTCDMYNTSKQLIENFADQINKYGHVLNGARSYLSNRSQPPVLALMVSDLVEYFRQRDLPWEDWLRKMLPLLVQEHLFWTDFRSVPIKGHVLNRYDGNVSSPRPEMYRKDFNDSRGLSKEDQVEFYRNVVAAAESGWDFSSRWYQDVHDTQSIHTRSVIPVDLNMILLHSEFIILQFARDLKDSSTEKTFTEFYEARKEAIVTLLWSETSLKWSDMVYENGIWTKSQIVSSTDFMGLWGNHFTEQELNANISQVVNSFLKSGLLQTGGVLSTTTRDSGQQWDSPNTWAPNTFFIMEALLQLPSAQGNQVGLEIARRWIESTYTGFQQTGEMHEKYNAYEIGQAGSGGEYPAQLGFGWTNGLTLYVLHEYYQHAKYNQAVLFSSKGRRAVLQVPHPLVDSLLSQEL